MPGRILYLTDRNGITSGYEPAFTAMVSGVKIPRGQIIAQNIYKDVPSPLMKKGNQILWVLNPECRAAVLDSFERKVRIVKPGLIVVADAAVLGIIDPNGTLEKCRGGVYDWNGIPLVVTYPITALHQKIDSSFLKDADGELMNEQPYRMPSGGWILNRDWEKIGRIWHGKERRLPDFEWSVIRNREDMAAAREYLKDSVCSATDIETGVFPPQITCTGIGALHKSGSFRAFIIPYYDPTKEDGVFWESEDDHIAAWQVQKDYLASPIPKMMQNGAYDCSYFIRDQTPAHNFLWDSMLGWWSLFPELPKTLDFIASILLDNYRYWKDDIKGIEDKDLTGAGMNQYWRYCALDCYTTLFNGLYLLGSYRASEKMREVYRSALMRSLSAQGMSMRGVRADFRRRNEHRDRLTRDRDQAAARLKWMIDDPEFNVNSPDQKVQLIYGVLGARPRNAKGRYVGKDGKGISSGAIPLKIIKTEHPIFKRVINAIEQVQAPDKQISNICNMYLATNRIRTFYGAAGTETGRLNSKKSNFWDGGNVQNWRKEFRDWAVADEDCLMFEADFSQSDDVFVGFEANDPDKIRVYESGDDAHAVNGELFFGMPYAEIVAGKKAKDPRIVDPTKGIRQLSKRIVHGTNFVMAAMTLFMTMGREAVEAAAKLMGESNPELWDQARLVLVCEQLMHKYRKRYKRLTHKAWYAELMQEIRATGGITNAYGMYRKFMGDPKDDGTLREAAAFVGQSDTAYNMNRCMDEIVHGYMPKRFRDGDNPNYGDEPLRMDWRSHGFSFHLQTHDSFTVQLDTTNPNWKRGASNLLRVMARPVVIGKHTFSVRTEAEFMTEWGGFNIPWGGDESQLDDIASQLMARRSKRWVR